MYKEKKPAKYSYRSFFMLEFGYVFLLLVFYATQFSDMSKDLANVYAVVILAWMILCLTSGIHRLPGRDIYILFGILVLLAINISVNINSTNLLDAVKIGAIFLFYFAGKSTRSDHFDKLPGKLLVRVFVLLPVFISIFDLYFRGQATGDAIGDTTVAFFSNRNNAVLYSVVSCWILALANVNRWMILAYMVGCALVFKTLGALVAVGVAIYLVYFGLNFLKLMAIAVIFLALYFAIGPELSELSVFGRMQDAMSGVTGALSASGGLLGLDRMNYGELAHAAGTTDISFIFRLKHWINIINIYDTGSIWHQLFGFGVDSSLDLTDLNLLPHNDYLRFFFELGPGLFSAFLGLNALIVWRIGRTLLMIPAIFIFVYCFSENIVNNFLVMTLFYYMAGALTAQRPRLNPYLAPSAAFANAP
ncbi:hypothetical protein [Caballeronia sp. LjRoot31]|uniref:hypothetical protein n=1 Tax=Caballeronia sp. LjRoot31 TaxID=3342324 RepID=UPI003ED0B79C